MFVPGEEAGDIEKRTEAGNYFLSLNLKMSSLITISSNIQSGEPVFTNTRVPIKNLFDYLKAGHSLNDFLEDFPSITKEHAIQVLSHFKNTPMLS